MDGYSDAATAASNDDGSYGYRGIAGIKLVANNTIAFSPFASSLTEYYNTKNNNLEI
jgi:hypothetical protein